MYNAIVSPTHIDDTTAHHLSTDASYRSLECLSHFVTVQTLAGNGDWQSQCPRPVSHKKVHHAKALSASVKAVKAPAGSQYLGHGRHSFSAPLSVSQGVF